MREDVFEFPALERLIYGKSAAAALAAEVERIDARRVFLVVSGTMNRTTDEVEKVRAALGTRYAGTYDGIPPFTPRSAVLKAAELARSAGADFAHAAVGVALDRSARNRSCDRGLVLAAIQSGQRRHVSARVEAAGVVAHQDEA